MLENRNLSQEGERENMKLILKKMIIVLLIMTIGFYSVAVDSAFANDKSDRDKKDSTSLQNNVQIIEANYSTVLNSWNDIPPLKDAFYEYDPTKSPSNAQIIVESENSYGYTQDTIKWGEGSELTIDINVEQTGLYTIGFDYYILDENILSPEGHIKVNNEYQYYESRRIVFQNLWKTLNENKPLDRYGNELQPEPENLFTWQKTFAYDASYLHMKPLLFLLNKGSNQIKLVNDRGDMLIGKLYVESPDDTESYDSYARELDIAKEESLSKVITIEAEDIQLKNDSSIRLFSESDPGVTPYETRKQLLNILDGDSWSIGGQAATWEFKVEQSGYYHIGYKYEQSFKYDLPVYRKIEIDGKVPFSEVEDYPFNYATGWQNEILSDGTNPYYFYLEKGTHTMTMTVSLSQMRELAETLTQTMKEINKLTLEIQKLTGNKVDKYRDWNLETYIPDVKDVILKLSDDLEEQYEHINSLNSSKKEIGEIVNLKISIEQLRKLAKEPNELPNKLNLLSQGSTSVSQMLGDLLQRITDSPLSLDKIYVFSSGEKLPKPNANSFTKAVEASKRFFLSFVEKEYSTVNKNQDELDVWVNRPRQFVELMQKMIDEDFTPSTGIRVKLSIMPDENKLILANASGDQPDATLGVNHWLPYELAIRGAVLDLRSFDDYSEVIKQFSKGAVIPFAYEDGVYALPETQDFWVMMYRTDIMNSLNIPIPDTWNDVIEILPELQRLGMNFYSPISLSGGFKPFNATTPFIYQFNGELFNEDGMTTAIDSQEALEGIRLMADLFTIYNLPEQVPNFYHHFRYGTLPIGISNFQSGIQLKTAAPEIANWWEIGLHPGVERDGEIQRWAPAGGQTGMIFKETKQPEESWEFLKWWMSKDVQVKYANQLQTTYGPTYMWNTANLDAFEQLPWPEKDKKVVLEQFKWVREASRVPGAYMVEREISNSWNKIVFDGENSRTTIDEAVITIDREITRKMEEFGYWKDGKIVKPYKVPTIETIDEWIENNE